MRRTLALALFAALALPVVGAQAADPDCARGSDAATITNPKGGTLSVKSQTGTITIGTGATEQGAMLSTTGTIDVEVKHSCMAIIRLLVKDGNGAVIHDTTNEVVCEKDLVFTQSVNIGLNGGEYSFSLENSHTCSGAGIKDAGNGHYVIDPPLRGATLIRELT